MAQISGPTVGVRGGPINLNSTVANQGLSDSGSFAVGFYLSIDPVITTADMRIGTRSISSLAGGASNSALTTLTIPTIMNPMPYYIGAIADYTNIRVESNEANNSRTGNMIMIQ